uniref:Septin-type G domain-containing protein n=1 Tax=Kwoniella bestiolae CBS 10118 TaxID=1296100 RepID=A0A1B9FRQ6_9TREE|nr:hypothetical protein I302_09127 [Kwoniella bestiolae CBS 10118]OCF21448.1 hypothetical protein I302_09127 [Kwoniella bestiolae CBS 10118]
MAPSFLRKRARPQSVSPTDSGKVVRPSLSLPDLTTPLLDISSWEEVPPFKLSPKHPQSQGTDQDHNQNRMSFRSRGKKPSLVSGDTQFHRPFTPKLVNSPTTQEIYGIVDINFDRGAGVDADKNDFRKSKIGWSSDHPFSQPINLPPTSWNNTTGYRPASNLSSPSLSQDGHAGVGHRDSLHRVMSRRKNRKKGTVGKLNFVVVGGQGVGKTSFTNLLLSSLSTPEHPTPFIPLSSTKSLSAYTAISTISEKLLVRIIDTPGLDLKINDELSLKSRERGVGGLIRLLEDRFEVMCEEEKKIRRMTGGEEGLIHLVIYMIDARTILYPQSTRNNDPINWSCLGLFDDDAPSSHPSSMHDEGVVTNNPRVSEVEIEIIRKLSKRSNVLPILTHSDCLTVSELKMVKEAMKRDLGDKRNDIPGKGFGIFNEADEASRKSIDFTEPDSNRPSIDQNKHNDTDDRPPTPDSLSPPETTSEMPYSLFLPDHTTTSSIIEEDPSRKYKWGEAKLFDPLHSDFLQLKENILGENSKILRSTTREMLYENYRTERLLAKTGMRCE